MNKTLRKIDRFGMPVRLTHEGEHEFKTAFGGGLTILLIVFLLIYGLQGLSHCFIDDIRSMTEEISWIDVDKQPYFNPGHLKNSKDDGFNLAWGFYDERMPENIGKWSVEYVVRLETKTG